MLDRDVADILDTTTDHINTVMKRNIKRFPDDFCFRLTQQEKDKVTTNCRHLEQKKYSPVLPYGYTLEGCNMLAMLLHSDAAISRSIFIIRAFTYLERNGFINHRDAPPSPLLPNGWQMHCMIKIHGTEGAAKILRDQWGIHPDGFKDDISPFEASVIRKDNPNKLHRDQCILELADRGVSPELIASLSGITRTHIHGIIKSMGLIREQENKKAFPRSKDE